MPNPDVNLDRIGGTQQSGANVVDQTNSAVKVNVVAGAQLPATLDANGLLKVHEQGTANVTVNNNPNDALVAALADTDGNLVAVTDNALDVHIKPDDTVQVAVQGTVPVAVQGTIPVSPTTLEPNAAQETGGNLALLASLIAVNNSVCSLQQQTLEILRQINGTLNALLLLEQSNSGSMVDRDDVMGADTNLIN